MNFETLATGYYFLEAPRADGQSLWFTDLIQGGLYRWTRGRDVERFFPERKHIGGIALNEDGTVIFGGPGGLHWFDPKTGTSGALLDNIDGTPLAGTNDMLPDGKGGLIFGTLATAEGVANAASNALYRLRPDGSTQKLVDGIKVANGIGLSPDGSKLYHNESLVGTFVYDVKPDGSLSAGKLFWVETDGDGMAVDAQGNVWIARFASGEIICLAPDGAARQHIPVPHKVVASLCFGGVDWRDLYVVTAGNQGVDALVRGETPPLEASVFYARSDIPGLPVPRTSFRIVK